MIRHLSLRARAGLALFAAVSIGLFGFLGARFGGPGVHLHQPLVLRAAPLDTQGLAPDADVLVRGVRIGHVGSIAVRGDRALTALELGGGRPRLYADASARVGTKTPLGEAFVDLDPGHRAAGPFDPRRALRVRPSVQVDEALGVLGARPRADLRALLRTSAGALAGPSASVELSETLAGLRRATGELRLLGGTLRGQDSDLAVTVQSSRVMLRELAEHDAAVHGIVTDGLRTLRGAGADPAALRRALAQLPGVLADARSTLASARALLRRAVPVARDARLAAPPLAGALREAPGTLREARALLVALPALRASALPALTDARPFLRAASPAARALDPVLADAVPMARYLAPRSRAIAAWFANTAALGQSGDAKGRWARFLVLFDPATAFAGAPAPAANAYPQPGDAAHNAPYRAGDYPRLRPYGRGGP